MKKIRQAFENDRLFREKCDSGSYYKKEEKKKVNLQKIIGVSRNSRRHNILATPSSFRSEAELISNYVNNAVERKSLPVTEINPNFVSFDKKMSRTTKAALLAKKYKHHHYLLRRFCYKKIMSEKMADIVFKIVADIKSEEETK